jgi:hypothetical protein
MMMSPESGRPPRMRILSKTFETPEERKDFFFEKKKQKTFIRCGPRQSQRARNSPKVFWFFFS